jgi:hypothetical protein
MRSGAEIKILDDLTKEAIWIDNDLFELKLEEEIYAS